MSWDADLIADDGTVLGGWNYTHNTSRMIYLVLDDVERTDPTMYRRPGERWYDLLNGQPGPEGARRLHTLITSLEADPERFTALNPDNGWGSYENLVKILTKMRNAVPERPCRWEASG